MYLHGTWTLYYCDQIPETGEEAFNTDDFRYVSLSLGGGHGRAEQSSSRQGGQKVGQKGEKGRESDGRRTEGGPGVEEGEGKGEGGGEGGVRGRERGKGEGEREEGKERGREGEGEIYCLN